MCHQVEKDYACGLAYQKAKSMSQDALNNILDFYKEHKTICDKAYQYYRGYEADKALYVKAPIQLSGKDFQTRLQTKKILLLTANPIERGILLRWLSGKNQAPLDTYLVEEYAYNIYHDNGNGIPFSLIHLSPGTTGPDATQEALNISCNLFQPDLIIALGICYGFNRKECQIGYVLLSDTLVAYRLNFRDSDNEEGIKLEAEIECEASPEYRMITSIRQQSQYIMVQNILCDSSEPEYAPMKMGKFFSTDSLMSNKAAKDQLYIQASAIRPKPLGGEMEGPGILKSNIVRRKNFTKWLLIKSICAWGERKNDLDSDAEKSERIKDSLQAFSMSNTCSVFEKLLSFLCEV